MASESLSTGTVWLITGCSSGFGVSLAKQLFATGHTVIATARKPSTLSYLPESPRVLKLALDVTSIPSITSAFAAAVEKFGKIDVVINNAGYTLMGDTEAAGNKESRENFDVNFWGLVDVTKEAVRVFREVNEEGVGGLIVQVTTLGAWVAFPGNAFYHASKFAVEGFTESFAKELNPDWNINFLILEPGAMKTAFASSSMKTIPSHPAYDNPAMPTRQLLAWFAENFATQVDDPDVVAKVALDVINGRGARKLPVRLPLGKPAFALIKGELESVQKELDEWKDVIESAGSI